MVAQPVSRAGDAQAPIPRPMDFRKVRRFKPDMAHSSRGYDVVRGIIGRAGLLVKDNYAVCLAWLRSDRLQYGPLPQVSFNFAKSASVET